MSVNTSLSGLSQTAASNGPDGSVDPPSALDDQQRYHGSFLALIRDGAHQWLTSVAGTNTITGSCDSIASYAAGQAFAFVAAATNSGAATLNIGSIGAKSITKNGTTALSGGEIQSGQVVRVVYDGTQFQLLNPSPFVSGTELQKLVYTDAGSTTSSSSFVNVTASVKNITPKSSNSTFLVEVTFQAGVTAGGAGTNTQGTFQLYNNTTAANVGNVYTMSVQSGAGSNLQADGMGIARAVVTNTGLTTVGFLLRAKYSTVTAATVSATSQVWTICEIQN